MPLTIALAAAPAMLTVLVGILIDNLPATEGMGQAAIRRPRFAFVVVLRTDSISASLATLGNSTRK